MPIRTASFTKRLADNGRALHRAMMSRGADQEPSEAEQALVEQRRQLKEDREQRRARAQMPGPSALDKLVRTHHAQAKDKPKATKDEHGKDVKKPKARRSRAEKHAEQAAAVEAARHSRKTAAKPGGKPAAKPGA